QNGRMVSLLPPVGTEVFRRFTPASLQEIQQHEAKKEQTRTKEGHEKDPRKPAILLEAGKPLPFIFGDTPPQLLNTPLEELDPFYQSQQTFIVLSKGNIIHRFNAESTCFSVRLFIMLTLLINCFLMTMRYPPPWSATAEYTFMSIYTFEIIIKVLSRGFCMRRFTFLRDPWNWLDVVVVSTAFLMMFEHMGKVSVLSTMCRGLKLISVCPGMKMTARALVQSVKRFIHVTVLMVFGLSVLALIGLVLFMATLNQKCVLIPQPSPSNLTNISHAISYQDNNTGSSDFDFEEYISKSENYYFLPDKQDPLLCGNSSTAGVCPKGYHCRRIGKNPNYGFTNFDSFGWSLLAQFRLMTKDYWENLLQLVLRGEGKSFVIVFMLIIFPSCFCLVSLILAAVALTSLEQDKAAVTEARQKEEEFIQIQGVIKSREEEEVRGFHLPFVCAPLHQTSCRAELSEKVSTPPKKKSKSHKQEGTAMEELEEDQRSCSLCWYRFANLFLKWNCCGCWRWLKQRLYTFVTHPFFDLGIIICIILNTIFMAMVHYPMTYELYYKVDIAVLVSVFTLIFTVEMLLKIMALDPYGYFKVGWNIYECIIICGSLINLLLANLEGLSVMELFELMRVLRLARWWPTFNMLLKITYSSLKALGNLTFILFIMVFVFSLVGMQLFQDDNIVENHNITVNSPRWHMQDFFHTFLLIFRILCGEWIETLWDCMEVSGPISCLIFYLMVLVIGNLLVLTLFLALLLSSFSSEYLVAPEEKTSVQITMNQIGRAVGRTRTWILEYICPSQGKKGRRTRDQKGRSDYLCCYCCCPFLDIDTSQGSGRVWFNFRRACLSIVQHNCFEAFIIFIILLSCVALVFEDIHLRQGHAVRRGLDIADLLFNFLFLLEMVLKWIGSGFKKYYSCPWCRLDFLILAVSLMSLMAETLGYSGLVAGLALRTVRALRPLRILSRFQGLRVVMRAMAVILPSMCNVLLVTAVVWLIFSIWGVNLFGGKFYHCLNETTQKTFYPEEVNNISDCLALSSKNPTEVLWKNKEVNFDSVAQGYLSLLQVATLKGWIDIMYSAVDSRRVEEQPFFEDNLYMYLYFIFFIIFGCFFTINLFIRVFIDTLNLHRYKIRKHVFMTAEQQQCSQTMKKRLTEAPVKPLPRPQSECLARLFDLVTHLFFEVFMVVVICLNVVVLMTETYHQSLEKDMIIYWLLFIFIIIFFIEFLLKIIALRRHYFTISWNIVDFVVLVMSILGESVSFTVLTLCPEQRIQKLLLALLMSLPALVNICLLLFLLMFTFSIFGMINFAHVMKGGMIDDMLNFETFGNSMICMFVVTTTAGWDGFLVPFMNNPPKCNPDIQIPGSAISGNCGNRAVAIVFFTSYILLSLLLTLLLYIAVILETFSSDDTEQLSDDDLQMFYKTWVKFDPNGSQLIEYSQLSDFCDSLQDPLRVPKPNTIKLIHMDLPLLPGDKIHCLDILLALTLQVFGDSGERDTLKARMEEKFMADNSSKVSCEPISSTLRRKQEEVAATVIQRAYRKHLAQEEAVAETPAGASTQVSHFVVLCWPHTRRYSGRFWVPVALPNDTVGGVPDWRVVGTITCPNDPVV
uniref:EF-hand domain-containing protein n=1 Tax=Monopterus albus TaxID=43700 RepID=A0A3Q3QX93_MONAL